MSGDGWSSRKVWVAIVAFCGGTTLLVTGYIDAGVWQWFSSSTLVAYLAANVAEKVTNGKITK